MALVRLLDEEGNRSRTLAETELMTDMQLEVRTIEAQQAGTEANSRIFRDKLQVTSLADQRKDLALRHIYWRFTVSTVSPVIFAILVAVFMFLFWKWQQPEAAGAFEKILVMVITGGLGWVAGRSQGAGLGRREDRHAQARPEDPPTLERASPQESTWIHPDPSP